MKAKDEIKGLTTCKIHKTRGKKQKQKPDKQIDEDFDKLFALFNRKGERQYEKEREGEV